MPLIHRIGPSPGSKSSLAKSGLRLFVTRPDISDLLGDLDVGDLLAGRVVKNLTGSRVLMNFRGTELFATTALPLTEGENVRGIVQAKGPPLILKILSDDVSEKTKIFLRFKSLAAQLLPAPEDHSAIAFLKTLTAPKGDWIEPLARWFALFALGERNPPDPDRVRAAMIHGGMFYERKLRQWVEAGGKGNFQGAEIDLKGAVLKLLGQIESHGKGADFSPERATGLLESIIGRIELFQTANWLAREEGLGLVFQIPFRFGNDLRVADLLVDLPRREGRKKDRFRILLLLDMGGLGHFQIEADISRKGVVASIGVDRQEVVALVQSMTEELKKGLESQELSVVGIECFRLEKPAKKADLFQQLLVMNEGEGVNIRV